MRMAVIVQAIFMVCQVSVSFGVTIEGFAPGFKGKVVYLERYSDYITLNKVTVTTAQVDEESKFTLSVPSSDAYEAFLRIDNNSGIIYIDPDTEVCQVVFPQIDKIREEVMRENRISLVFIDPEENDLNTLILEFNYRKDDFLYRTVVKDTASSFSKMEYAGKNFQRDLDAFKDSLNYYYKGIAKPFFIDYVTYSVAEMEQLAGIREMDITRAYLYNAYLKGIKVRYNYAGYMRFFNLYFNDFFKVPYFGPEEDIIDAVNFHESYQRCMLVLGRTKLLEDTRLRELVLMKNLLSVFHHKRYSSEGILTILDSINMTSPYVENREIALHVLQLLTKMTPGVPAPRVGGVNIKTGERFSLANQPTKYIYLMFYATWCKPCQAEMELIPGLKKKYGEYVEFVTVFIDDNEEAASEYVRHRKNYDWNFISIRGDRRVLDAYQVVNVPYYVLIDREGLVDQAPCRAPSPDGAYLTIDKDFFEIKKRLEPKREFKVGGKN